MSSNCQKHLEHQEYNCKPGSQTPVTAVAALPRHQVKAGYQKGRKHPYQKHL